MVKTKDDIASYIVEKGDNCISGKVYIPILVADNLELQIGFTVLYKVQSKLEDRDKNSFSPFNLLVKAMTSRIIENTRYTFQMNSRTRGLAVHFFEDVKDSSLDKITRETIKSKEKEIAKLYPEAISDYQDREIHLHDDRSVAIDAIHESTKLEGMTINKTTVKRAGIDAAKINKMFELLAESANLVKDGRYCYITRVADLDQIIDSYERLFNVKIDNRDSLKKSIKENIRYQEELLGFYR